MAGNLVLDLILGDSRDAPNKNGSSISKTDLIHHEWYSPLQRAGFGFSWAERLRKILLFRIRSTFLNPYPTTGLSISLKRTISFLDPAGLKRNDVGSQKGN